MSGTVTALGHGVINILKNKTKKFQQCREGKINFRLCVCVYTDVAARGLDIPAVTWVVQFDAPQVYHHYLPSFDT